MIGPLVGLLQIITAMGTLTPPRVLPPVAVETREHLRETEERNRSGEASKPLDIESQRQFDEYMARMDYLSNLLPEKGPPTIETASKLESELYVDVGLPYLNGRWQQAVVDQVVSAARTPGVAEEVLGSLRRTLIEYASLGGGSASPPVQLDLARALAVVGGAEHKECDDLARALCNKAEDWAKTLEYAPYITLTEAKAKVVRETISWQPQSADNLAKAPPQVRRALSAFDSAIRSMMLGEKISPDQVDRAATLATGLEGSLQVDAVSRLLIVFHGLLSEKRGVSKSVVQAVDRKLLWLAKDSKALSTKEHWLLWAEDLSELGGHRASKDLERFVHESEKKLPNNLTAEAIKRAADGLRRR